MSKKGKPKPDASIFNRDNTKQRDKFIKKVEKECAFITIKQTRTSKENEFEPIICFRGRKIVQLAFSAKAFWSSYQFGKEGRSIYKVHNQEEFDVAYDWVTNRVQELEDQLNSKPVKKSPVKKPKIAKTNKTPEQLTEDIKNRVASMSPKSNGIAFPKGVLGNEDWFKTLTESEGYIVDLDNRVIAIPQE